MNVHETPSRILRRIKDNEAKLQDLPSLPSISFEEDTEEEDSFNRSESDAHGDNDILQHSKDEWNHSTPLAYPNGRSGGMPRTSATPGSRVRFANAIMTRSADESSFNDQEVEEQSLEASKISVAIFDEVDDGVEMDRSSRDDVREVVTSDDDEGLSIINALKPVSPAISPGPTHRIQEKSYEDIEVSIKASPKASPFDPSKWGSNISRRKVSSSRQRVPSLSHSQSSESSSSSNATPSVHSLPLATPSRHIHEEDEDEEEQYQDHRPPSHRTSSSNGNSIREAVHETPRPQMHDRDLSLTQSTMTSSNSALDDISQQRPSPVARAFSSPALIPSSPQLTGNGPLPHLTPHSKRAFALVTSSARPKLRTPAPHSRPMPTRGARFSLPGFLANELSLQAGGPDGSYMSTASSHDLTIHPRANASFDHIADAHGRLDRVKVNRHVHRLNQMLGEENTQLMTNQEQLIADMERLTKEKEELLDLVAMLKDGVERKEARIETLEEGISGDGRGVLTELNKTKKELSDVKAQYADYVNQVEDAFDNLDRGLAEKDEEIAQAKEELEEEQRAKDRLSEKHKIAREALMKDTRTLVMNLEKQREESDAEAKRSEMELAAKVAEAESLRHRLEATGVEAENVKKAEERAELARREKEDLSRQVQNLEREMESAVSKKEREIGRLEKKVTDLEDALNEQRDSRASIQRRVDEKSRELEELRQDMDQLASELGLKNDKLGEVNNHCERLQGEVRDSRTEVQRAEDRVKKMELALQRAEERVEEWQVEKRALESKERVLRREKEDVERLLVQAQQHHSPTPEKSRGEEKILLLEHEKVVNGLEAELDKAYKQVGRLEGNLKGGSEIRKVVMEGKEAELVLLRKEREELRGLVQGLKDALLANEGMNESVRLMVGNEATPGKKYGGYNTTPAKLRQSFRFRTPKTPGVGLKEPSILNQTTMSMSGIAPILGQLERMQSELVHAYDRVDDKMDKLQQAGRDTMKLRVTVSDLEGKIKSLEAEVEILRGKEGRVMDRLNRWKCRSCGERSDFSRYFGSSTPSTSNSEGDVSVIRLLNEEHEKLRMAKQLLETQKADLAKQLKKMNVEIQDVKDDGERQLKYLQVELERAQKSSRDLESQLASERSKMKKLSAEQEKGEKGTAEIVDKLEQTQTLMDDVKSQLKNAKQRAHDLENELRANSDKEQKVRALEQKVEKNRDTVQRLRSERDVLSSDYSALRKQYEKMTKELDSTRQQVSSAKVAHARTQDQLHLQENEVDELRKSLSRRPPRQRQSSKTVPAAPQEPKKEISSAVADAQVIIASLETDLQQVRKDAERFGRDLADLRAEDEMKKREHSQLQSENKVLQSHLEDVRREKQRIEDYAANHICQMPGVTSDADYHALQMQHKAESKGLIVQCKYLKARITRETAMRGALTYQKNYLLQLISVLEEGEQRILAAIARTGFPKQKSPPRRLTLKIVASMVVFLIRTKKSSDAWREQCAVKDDIASALQQVRQRRQQH